MWVNKAKKQEKEKENNTERSPRQVQVYMYYTVQQATETGRTGFDQLQTCRS